VVVVPLAYNPLFDVPKFREGVETEPTGKLNV
jgi:hypothetical protein